MTEKVIEIPTEYRRLFDSDWREAAVFGGRFSLKSHTVARVLLIKARTQKTRIACFREYQNSITDSSYQLLVDLIKLYDLQDFKITDNSIINTLTRSDFLFKGLRHNEQSIKSIEGIDIAWVEEAQTVSSNSLEVLTPTIRKPGSQIIYTYNRLTELDPVHERLVVEGRPNTLVIQTDYRIAQKYGFLTNELLQEIESDRLNRPSLYRSKWLGEPMGQEIRIYKDWQIIDEIPHEARLERRWLDFGYSNDPSAIGSIYYYNGGYILDEHIYQKGLSNKQLADALLSLDNPSTLVIADSAEPKSIDELRTYGVNILPCEKGKDSVKNGIQLVQDQRLSFTQRSTNLKKEYQGYMWLVDKNGKILNEENPVCANHHMSGIRYAITSLKKIPEVKRDLQEQFDRTINRQSYNSTR